MSATRPASPPAQTSAAPFRSDAAMRAWAGDLIEALVERLGVDEAQAERFAHDFTGADARALSGAAAARALSERGFLVSARKIQRLAPELARGGAWHWGSGGEDGPEGSIVEPLAELRFGPHGFRLSFFCQDRDAPTRPPKRPVKPQTIRRSA